MLVLWVLTFNGIRLPINMFYYLYFDTSSIVESNLYALITKARA